jgi:hypothetical protein
MSRAILIGATAFIWIFIKLPQEWWIHIAQLDMTDFIQETIFGVEPGTSWVDTFFNRPWIVVIAVVVVIVLVYAAYWLMKNKLPPRDRPLTIDADTEPGREVPPERLRAERERMARRLIRPGLLEKLGLVALTSIIFGQMLQVHAGVVELSIIVGIIVIANAALSAWLERYGFGPGPALRQFIVTGLLNLGIVVVMLLAFELLGDPAETDRLGTFVLLITLLVTLYDRYRPEYVARFAATDQDRAPA